MNEEKAMARYLDELRNDGITRLIPRFDIESFQSFMNNRPVYNNHVRQGKPETGPLGSHPWMCHDPHDSVRAPGLLEFAIKHLPVAKRALGTSNPYIFSLNTFYTEPNTNPKPDIQGWHRDSDDPAGFLALFVYGSDILLEADGPHQFQKGTHANNAMAGPYPVAPVETVYGPAGTAFMTRSNGIHQGLVPKTNRRMLIWARFCVSNPPPAYQWDGLTPLDRNEIGFRYPRDAETQEAIQLVVR